MTIASSSLDEDRSVEEVHEVQRRCRDYLERAAAAACDWYDVDGCWIA